MMLLVQFSVFWRYFWNFNLRNPVVQGVYNVLLIGSQSLESIIQFLICYFFTKKASHFLEDNSRFRGRLRIFMAVAMAAVISVTIIQAFMLGDIGTRFSGLCKTLYFILPNTLNQIVNIVFVFVGCKISNSIREFNNGQLALIEDEADISVVGPKQEILARKRSMRNMWIIIGSISFMVTYQSIYSFVLYFAGDDYCIVVQDRWIRSWSTIFARSLQYILWYYPIIWLFWPPAPSCCRKKQKKVVYRHLSEE